MAAGVDDMNFPICIQKDPDSDYSVSVPDLPGCVTAGITMNEAVSMAKEAIELHMEGIIEDGAPIPEPGQIDDYVFQEDYRDGTWALIQIDPANLRVKTKRVNVTLPERTLDAIDEQAEVTGESRSRILAKAIFSYLERGAARSQGRGRPKSTPLPARNTRAPKKAKAGKPIVKKG